MKQTKTKKPLPSEILFDQAKKMELKLKQIKDARSKQEEKKKALPTFKDGSHWRSSVKKKGVSNYSSKVLDQQPRPNKTVTNTQNANFVQMSGSNPSNTQQISGQKAASNLSKALTQQKAEEDFSQVDNFLDSIKLKEKYRYLFIDNGIEELQTILELDDSHLQTMKIPLGHKLKILKKIREINGDHRSKPQGNSVTQSSSTSNAMPRKSALKNTGVTAHYSQLQELQPPPVQARPVNSIQTSQTSTNASQQGGSLLQGQYNESESHQSFKLALQQWRSGKPAAETSSNSVSKGASTKKEVRFIENNNVDSVNKTPPSKQNSYQSCIGDGGKPGSFFANIGDSENWNVNCIPQHQNVGTQGDFKKQKSDKQSCWQCYKLYPKEKAYQKYSKSFCGEQCFNKYVKANQIKCQNSFGECKNEFLKINGELKQGNWYCSSKCATEAIDALDSVQENQFGNWQGENDQATISMQNEEIPELDV